MADHPMNFVSEVPSAPATNEGLKLWVVEQATDAAVNDNDTLTFPQTREVRIISIVSATGQVVNFDTKVVGANDIKFTVDHSEAAASKKVFGTLATGTAETSVKGLVLARRT